jgi:hypothetical protein
MSGSGLGTLRLVFPWSERERERDGGHAGKLHRVAVPSTSSRLLVLVYRGEDSFIFTPSNPTPPDD